MTGVPFDDRGLTLGDGLFETVLARQGKLVLWDEHVARLCAGCDALGLPRPDPESLREAAFEALLQAGMGDERAAVRLTWTAGSGGRGLERPEAPSPRLLATAGHAPMPGPASLVTVSIRRNPTSPTSHWKTLSYLDNLLARHEARTHGADEALMLNTAGEVACAAAGNIFWISQGTLFTPALECGVLPGVVRACVLAAAHRMGLKSVEVRATLEHLKAAEAAFITNSLVGLRTVRRLDGRDLGLSPLVGRLVNQTAELHGY